MMRTTLASLLLLLTDPALAQEPAWTEVATPQGPPARYLHSAVYDSERKVVVLTCGQAWVERDGKGQWGALDDTWEWDGKAWRRVRNPERLAVHSHAAAFDPVRKQVVLFGGETWIPTISDDTWIYAEGSWEQVHSKKTPDARSQHAMAWDGEKVILFGGLSDEVKDREGRVKKPRRVLDDTWAWDGTEWTKLGGRKPDARAGHAMAFDAVRQRVVLMGGYELDRKGENRETLGDLWEWDGKGWSEAKGERGPLRLGAHLALGYDPARQRVVTFGGLVSLGFAGRPARNGIQAMHGIAPVIDDSTWEWDGEAWHIGPIRRHPQGRYGATLVSDPSGSGVLLIGGAFEDLDAAQVQIQRTLQTSIQRYGT